MENNITCAHNLPPSTATHHVVELQHHPEEDDEEFTCEICTETTYKKFRNGDKCVHPFCTDCVIKYIRYRLEDYNKIGHIKCPAPNCDYTLDPIACAPLIGPSLFFLWCDVLCEAAIMGCEMCYCPYRDCNFPILNECGGDLATCLCPRCKRLLCFRCKTVWHYPITCEENRDAAPLRKLAALKRWKSCPYCRHFVELAGGCRNVRCRCGIEFCYSCGNYRHACVCGRAPMDHIIVVLFIFLVIVLVPCGCYFFL